MFTDLNYENKNLYRNNFIVSTVVAFSIFSEYEENYRKLPPLSLNLLLVEEKTKDNNEQQRFSLPTSLIKKSEDSLQSIQRELLERAAILKCYIEQLFTFTDFNNLAYSIDEEQLASGNFSTISHIALFDNQDKNKAQTTQMPANSSDEKKQAQWFKVSYNFIKSYISDNIHVSEYQLELKNSTQFLKATILQKKNEYELDNSHEVSFCSGISPISAKIISYAIARLRGKVEYTDIAFRLLPENFSIKTLQKVYELILGKSLLDANFRRKVLPRLDETILEENHHALGHRKAKLYSVKKNKDIN